MQNQPKNTRRIDLSGCKLLSTYGRNVAEAANQNVKVGAINKPEIRPNLLSKLGLINKIGIISKPGR
jgi:hypothetical protein